ncbi:MAG: DUF3124 domain-containing protein [Dehalococcoidia bacterium]
MDSWEEDSIDDYVAATRELVFQGHVIDTRAGGAGATFMVTWVAGEEVSEPVVEAVMVGATGTQAFAFVRKGVVTAEREKK